jgi:ABC-type uncharacterized transport system substrate-binding protein
MMKHRLLTLVLLTILAAPASAHPHLFATMQTAIMTTQDGKVSGLRIRWNFDETYTQFSLEGLDLNANGTFEAEEIKPLTDENIKSLLESKYFTVARQNGAEIAQGPVTVYGQDMIDAKLSLWFELPFATPVDPKVGAVETRIYDPDFFIAFDYLADKPPLVEGKLSDGCSMELKPLPTTEELDQAREMLSDKPQDWKPDQPTDFGSMFAQPLIVSCG